MGKVIPMLGGGGIDLSVITAAAGDLLAGKVMVDGEGNPVEGTMIHRSDNPTSNRLTCSEGKVKMVAPRGFWDGVNDYVWDDQTLVAERGGLTAGVLMAGHSALGVEGTATSDAYLDPQFLMEGYSGYDNGAKNAGTAYDRRVKHGSPGINSEYENVPVHHMTNVQRNRATDGMIYVSGSPLKGFYSGGSDCYAGISDAEIISMYGISADKIRAGYEIAGVSGDSWVVWTGGASADPYDVLEGETYWQNGTLRTGTIPNHELVRTKCENIWWNRDGDNTLAIAVPPGYYQCYWENNSYEYIEGSMLMNALGITPDKIREGVPIGNIIGTMKDYSYLAEGQTSFNFGAFSGVLRDGARMPGNTGSWNAENGGIIIKNWGDISDSHNIACYMLISRKSIDLSPFSHVRITWEVGNISILEWIEILVGFLPKTIYEDRPGSVTDRATGKAPSFNLMYDQYDSAPAHTVFTSTFSIGSNDKSESKFLGIGFSRGDGRENRALQINKIEFLA